MELLSRSIRSLSLILLLAFPVAGQVVTERAAIVGTFGLEIEGDNSSLKRWVKTSRGALYDGLTWTWLVRWPDASFGLDSTVVIGLSEGMNGQPLWTVQLGIDPVGDSKPSIWATIYFDDGSTADTRKVRVDDPELWDPFYQGDFDEATGTLFIGVSRQVGAGDGEFSFGVNLVNLAQLTGLNLEAPMRNFAMGAPMGTMGMTGFLSFDEVDISVLPGGSQDGADLFVSGTATASGGADLSDDIQWLSSLDGFLGSGKSTIVRLSEGIHEIKAGVELDAVTYFSQIAVIVNRPPSVTVDEPVDGEEVIKP